MFFACTEDFLLDQNSKSQSCFWCFWCYWWLHPQTDVFFFFIAVQFALSFFFFVSEMDVEEMRGKGCTSIYPAIHFIPLRGLDYSGETKVIRIHVIPKIQQKKKKEKKSLQTAEPSFPPRRRRMLIHEKICRRTSHSAH